MFLVEARTQISAPPAVVWGVLMDMGRYKEWSTLLHAEQTTPPQPGQTIRLRLSMPNGPTYSFQPLVITLERDRHFAWSQQTGMKGIFDGEHHFVLSPVDSNGTLLHNYERYSGLLSPIIQRLPMMRSAASGFSTMNDEIKRRSEQLVSGESVMMHQEVQTR
ncbi:MAG: SRPBCC domain-containing protein [Pleurocapsa minor GSE-CHR-MK-17-07R]|jgi:hypothetical protein|nr:SRPBCC domain-containing protein [Pleurocapsa minor GSE-CHR-MK 17-07R]